MKQKLCLNYLLVLVVCLLGSRVLAIPPVVIKGKVTGDDGNPLSGVSITVKSGGASVITDAAGLYTIKIPGSKDTLVFSFLSYERKEVAVGSRTTIDVILRSSSAALDEVIVVGYGTQKKRELSSSVATMKGEEISKYNVNSFQTALQGQMPGVEMYESSGVPGAAVNVRIRGLNTINGSAGPLYVVDGIPIFSGGGGDGDSPITNDINGMSGTQTNPMTDINPNDIESIEVLKDAASAAIYGARGSGGVILITTKRAKNGKTSFNLSANHGIVEITKEKPLLNGPQLLMILDEAYKNTFYSNPANAGLPLPATPLPLIKGLDRGLADTTDVNHLHNIMQTGTFTDASLSASNGTDKTKFYFSGTYKKTVANIRGSEMSQYNFKINIDHSFNSFLRLGGSMAPSFNKEYRLGSGVSSMAGGYGSAISTTLPIYPLYNGDGTYFNPWTNTEAFLNRSIYNNNSRRTRLMGSAYLEVDLLPGLTSRTNVQREEWSQEARVYIDGLIRMRTANSGNISPFADDQLAYAGLPNSYGYTNSAETYFTYKKIFNKVHKTNTVLGMRFSQFDTRFNTIYGENFANRNFEYPSQAASISNQWQSGAIGEPAATLGYFLRINYTYRERYLLGMVINRDGSSRFGSDRRFGTFPAVSAGWIISDEAFMQKNKWISFFKLRASAGLTGNAQGISNTQSIATWSTQQNASGYLGTATANPNRPANRNLRWEKGTKYDVGVDISFLKNRISATIDLYHYTTTDMLLEIPTPSTFGYSAVGSSISFLENRGSLINKGAEFSINTTNIKSSKFTWNTTFNISTNITKIVDLGGLDPNTVAGGSGDVRLIPGKVGPVFYLLEWAGVDPQTGGELIKDADGKVVLANSLNPQQLEAAKRPQFDKLPAPKFYGGIGNNFTYKKFSLSVFFSYRVGNYIVDAGDRVASYVGNLNYQVGSNIINVGNMPATLLNRWTSAGQATDIPKLYYNDAANDVLRTRNTTRFMSDASFIRLKNVQFAYAIKAPWLAKLKITNPRVVVTGQNLFLLTRFKGVDPEAVTIGSTARERNIAYGIIQNPVPLSRTFTVGLNLGF